MSTYHIRLLNPDLQLDATLTVASDDSILDSADMAGIRLPSGCKQGNCSACVAKLVEGQVDQTEQTFLSPDEVAQGYILPCVAVPLTHCTLLTHQETVLYGDSLYFKKAESS